MNADLTTHAPVAAGVPALAGASGGGDGDDLLNRLAELTRLRSERPIPTDAERLPDWNWYFEQRNAGGLTEYAGRYIAIYRQQVVGDDTDSTWLELSLARAHPDRFVIEYVG